jgi:hypothetical protein
MLNNILICALAIGLIYTAHNTSEQAVTIEQQQQQIQLSNDTLQYFWKGQQKWGTPGAQQILGPRQLDLGDSLLEAHRIAWITSRVYCVQMLIRCDSMVWLIYKSGSLKNPLTKKGSDTIYFQQTKLLGPAVWIDFNNQLNQVNFLDATKHTQYFCCNVTGSIDWEAQYLNGPRRTHYTWCRQSVQFAEACESLFRYFDDPDLHRTLPNAIKFSTGIK